MQESNQSNNSLIFLKAGRIRPKWDNCNIVVMLVYSIFFSIELVGGGIVFHLP